MPYTVAVSFDRFFDNINLPGDHRETATARREHLVSLLKNDLSILDSFASGSIPRYTAVRGYADLDIIVVLHYGKHVKNKKPSEVLQLVRDALGEYKTNVRKNGQAVTLYYKGWPNVDVVPVSRVVNDDGSVNRYEVPDMNAETWISSRPRKHSNDLVERKNSFGEEFKKIIKMMKWWNHQHSSLLQSYHIEVLSLNILIGTFSNFPWEVFIWFDKAHGLCGSSLWHEGAHVDAYLDWTTRQEVLKRLATARDKSREAWHLTYGQNNDHERAIEIWRQVFGNKFPAYGS